MTTRWLVPLALTALGVAACGSESQPSPDDHTVGRGAPPRLQDVTDVYVDACEQAAERTTLPVVHCPPLIPDGKVVVGTAGPFGSGARATYVISVESAPPAGDGARPGHEHWVLSGWGDPAEALAFIRDTEGGRQVGTEAIEGVRTRTFAVPAGAPALDAGHVVVYWEREGVAYTVSVHGRANRPIGRAVAVALLNQMARCPLPAPDCPLTLPTQTADR